MNNLELAKKYGVVIDFAVTEVLAYFQITLNTSKEFFVSFREDDSFMQYHGSRLAAQNYCKKMGILIHNYKKNALNHTYSVSLLGVYLRRN